MKILHIVPFFVALCLATSLAAQTIPIKVTSQGLKADTTFLAIGNTLLATQDVMIGSEVDFYMEGIKGFTQKDGKGFPGCTMIILDKNLKALKTFDDLFAEYEEGVPIEDVRMMKVYLSVGAPIKPNDSYVWRIKVWDKQGKNSMQYDIPVNAKPATDGVGIKTTPKGLKAANVYARNRMPLQNREVKAGETITMVFDGMTGMKVSQEETVTLGLAMKLIDPDGTVMLEYTDLFKGEDVVSAELAGTLTSQITIGDPLEANTAYIWWIKIWDKNNSNSIESELKLEVIE